MSSHHKKRRNRKKALAKLVTCKTCHGPGNGSPQALMLAMAEILNTADAAGMNVLVRHSVIIADGVIGGGYVLVGGDGKWKAGFPVAPEPQRVHVHIASPQGEEFQRDFEREYDPRVLDGRPALQAGCHHPNGRFCSHCGPNSIDDEVR